MRRVLKAIGSGIKNFMIIFSFIVNLVLLVIVVVLGLLLFDIKNNIAAPLVSGLHSSFVGLDEATIDWTIPVRDRIPVVLNIPLETDTIVTLTQPVPLTVNAVINLPGVGTLNNAQVNLQLPAGLELPVHLDLNVPVDEELDVSLDVRAVIPLQQTQLHDPIDNLRLLFEPLTRALYNLPGGFDEVPAFVNDVMAGNVNLLVENDYSRDPWPGYSRTAGVGYRLGSEVAPPENQPIQTGIVPIGGIPALDEQLRADVYAEGGPQTWNATMVQRLQELGIPAPYYNGSYAQDVYVVQQGGAQQNAGDMGMQTVSGEQNTQVAPADSSAPPPSAPADTSVQAPAASQQGAEVALPPPDNTIPADPAVVEQQGPDAGQGAILPPTVEAASVPFEAQAAPALSEPTTDDMGILPTSEASS